MASSDGNGWLCHTCAKSGGKDPFKKPAAPKKRAPEKRSLVSFQEKTFPSLVTLCVQVPITFSLLFVISSFAKVITQNIDDVDAFGDIGTMNAEAIAKALSKSRLLFVQSVSTSAFFTSLAGPLRMFSYFTTQ